MKIKRVPLTVLATMIFLVISFNPTPSDTATSDPYRITVPSLSNRQALQDLARWVARSGAPERRFPVITPRDLDSALALAPPQQLELFPGRKAGESAARREMLVGLPYGTEIWRAAEHRQVDALLVAAIVEVESGFAPGAVSPKGATGLMQLLPSTAETYGAKNLSDPSVNLDVGSRYLGRLLDDFDGDLERTVAAYNAGPATVARYGGVPPFRETQQYVRKVLTIYRDHTELAERRAHFGRDPFAPLCPNGAPSCRPGTPDGLEKTPE